MTRGFASVEEPAVAVCLLPGTELAFENEVRWEVGLVFPSRRQVGHKVARFRQVNKDRSNTHHDALEFPDGQIVVLTRLCPGQQATVLQLPVTPDVTTNEAQMHEALAF
jgi:hypothetical protein